MTIRLSIMVDSCPPLLSNSLDIKRLDLLSRRTQHSSCSIDFTKGYMSLNTACGDDMAALERNPCSTAALLPSSNAAAMATALLVPIPFMQHRSSIVILERAPSLPSAERSSSLDKSSTFIPSRPILSKMASSSISVRASAPFATIFSRGISSLQSSLSFMSIMFFRKVRKAYPCNKKLHGYLQKSALESIWRVPHRWKFISFLAKSDKFRPVLSAGVPRRREICPKLCVVDGKECR